MSSRGENAGARASALAPPASTPPTFTPRRDQRGRHQARVTPYPVARSLAHETLAPAHEVLQVPGSASYQGQHGLMFAEVQQVPTPAHDGLQIEPARAQARQGPAHDGAQQVPAPDQAPAPTQVLDRAQEQLVFTPARVMVPVEGQQVAAPTQMQHASARAQELQGSARAQELQESGLAQELQATGRGEVQQGSACTQVPVPTHEQQVPGPVQVLPPTQRQRAPAPFAAALGEQDVVLAPAQQIPDPASAQEHQGLASAATQEQLYELLVRPIIKSTVGQRDTSGNTLAQVVINGSSFNEIIQQLWDQFSVRVKCRAVRTDAVWSTEPVDMDQWDKVMQLKVKKHVVDSTKSQRAWHQWLVKMRGTTVTLLVYEYGVAISRAQDLEEFKESCIRPEQTDRAGATAEVALRDVVASLQAEWGATFQADAVVWRMWANHVTRNLNRSTWEANIAQPPPEYVADLLQSADSYLERHLSNLTQSANVALDCVRASEEDYMQMRRDWEALGQRMASHERHLQTRRAMIESFIQDIAPPSPSEVTDPMLELQNVDDFEHAD